MTKTDKLEKGLIALGYARIEHASSRPTFSKTLDVTCPDGKTRAATHYVWLFTGTLRTALDPRIGMAGVASSRFIATVLKAAEPRQDVDFF